MLSNSTLEILNTLCLKSHEAYPEGGTLWTYTEAAGQAHTKLKEPWLTTAASTLNCEELAKWWQWALGDRDATKSSSVDRANELIAALRRDLALDDFLWSLEDNGSDMRGVLHMVRRADNRYFSLDLWWSED